MNVKPGDLAIQIKSMSGNQGKIRKVISWLGTCDFFISGLVHDCWLCQTEDSDRCPGLPPGHWAISDSWLRPVFGLPLQEDAQTQIKEPA